MKNIATISSKELPFEFNGTSREFFGIWIVNILLTVLTLGFYSPWAKVRTKRYFYGSTVLDNASFDYLADPKVILKGWVIVGVVLMVYNVGSNMLPVLGPIFMLAFLLLMPWLVVRAMCFRMRNTAWRNIRFSFEKDYREATKVFVGFAVLVPLSFGLLMPYFAYRKKKFLMNHASFGQDQFELPNMGRTFYEIYLVLAMIFFGSIMVLAFVLPEVMSPLMMKVNPSAMNHLSEPARQVMPWALPVVAGAFFITIVISYPYLQASISNAIWNNVRIADNRFNSTLSTWKLMWIYQTNTLAIMFSFGLLVPWTMIRLARYRIDNLTLLAASELEGFVARATQHENALADEASDVFDVDLGL